MGFVTGEEPAEYAADEGFSPDASVVSGKLTQSRSVKRSA